MQPSNEDLPENVRAYAADSQQDDAEVGKEHFAAPGSPTGRVYDEGVDWRAAWDVEHDGVAIATRRHIVALRDAGMPIVLRQTFALGETKEGDLYARNDQDLSQKIALELDLNTPDDPREVQIKNCLAIVHHVVPSIDLLKNIIYPNVSQIYDRDLMAQVARKRIVMAPFEREGISFPLANLLSRFGQIWVPCSRNRNMLVDAKLDPDRVHVVPHPMVGSHSHLATVGAMKRKLPFNDHMPVKLYSIGKFEPRKGQDILLEAFLRTFAPDGPDALATLAVKTSRFGRVRSFTTPEDLLRSLLAQPEIAARGWNIDNVGKWIKIVTGFVEDLTPWHTAGDVFVSASHGEGFDMPAFDAVQAGSRLVHVGFGGSEDFAPKNAINIPWVHEPCDPAYRWGQTAVWAGIRWEDVGHAMRTAVEQRQRGEDVDLEPYREKRVGQQMRDLIRGLS